MRWKIDKYLFEAQTNVLIGPSGKKLLEPKASALLKYFLQNPARNISRDELIRSVWDGQIVTDGAINRVVAQLRRELGDEAKIKNKIVTVPKTGYRFVCSATLIKEEALDQKPAPKNRLFLIGFFAVAAAAFWFWAQQTPQYNNPTIAPMVRLASVQTDASFASKTGQLAYVQSLGNHSTLYLAARADAPAVQVGLEGGSVDAPTWSHDNKKLLYRYIKGSDCTFRIIEFEQGAPVSDTPVYECRPFGAVSFAFNAAGTYFYFTEQQTRFGPSRANGLELATGLTRPIAQPLPQHKGNHHLDVNPTSGEILMLSGHTPGLTSAYSVDTNRETYKKLIDWPYEVEFALWGHNADTIVHPGEHPSYQLLETRLRTGGARVLVSDSRRIKEPARIENGQDYLFTSYIFNQDVLVGGQDTGNINSSVMDYLATLSNDGKSLAFISKRTGTSRIWIQDLGTGALRSIKTATAGQKLRAMHWAPSDRRILLSTSSGLLTIDSLSGKTLHSIKADTAVFAASWIDDRSLAYSLHKDGRWQLFRYSFETGLTKAEDSRWAFMLKNSHREIRVDQQMNIFEAGTKILGGRCAPLLRLQDLTLRLDGDDLYCISLTEAGDLVRQNKVNGMSVIPEAVSSTRHYSVVGGQIARTDTSSIVSDIMRTRYAAPPTQ